MANFIGFLIYFSSNIIRQIMLLKDLIIFLSLCFFCEFKISISQFFKFLKKNFLFFYLFQIFIFFIPFSKFILLNFFQGNFSPGSIFLKGAISEWPKKFSFLYEYFFFKFLHKLIKLLICF